MVRLQPRLPKFRKKKEGEEWEDGSEAPADRPREGEKGGHYGARPAPKPKPAEGRRPESPSGRKLQDKKLLMGIVILIAVVIVILIILWIYPMSQPRPERTVTGADVAAELARLQGINAYPENMNIDPYQYPKTFGVYARNNLTLEEIYFCSDVCPQYGAVYLVYKGADSQECERIGEKALHDLAEGGYIGCEPKVQG